MLKKLPIKKQSSNIKKTITCTSVRSFNNYAQADY